MKVICSKAKICIDADSCDHGEPHEITEYCEFVCEANTDSACVPVMYIAS